MDDGSWGRAVRVGIAVVGVLAGCGYGATRLLTAVWRSIEPTPPTARQLRDEVLDEHPLFRHLPQLRGQVAWRQIGSYPTPIHSVTAKTPAGEPIAFSVKREDLAHREYGGNKLRTLQHQLAACEAHQEAHGEATFSLLGSHGSNQVVATKLHGQRTFGLQPGALEALTFLPDKPDLDNTLNLLSSLSFGGRVVLTKLAGLRALLSRLWAQHDRVFPPGGHNVCGVLGQVGACLELAEQIERGETPDPEAIYLPYGSGCTTTGLTIGVALARRLGLKAFRSSSFKIVAVVVHHGLAALHGWLGALFWHGCPLSVSYSIDAVTDYLASMGVSDELKALCHETHESCLEIVTEPQFVGKYGSHSAKSEPAAKSYDATAKLTGADHAGFGAVPQWLCGHFAAKPFALMAERLVEGGEHAGKEVLFWQTKSHVQPVAKGQARGADGVYAERAAFEAVAPGGLRKWAAKGKGYSELRKGSWPDHYRHLMTEV